MNTPAKGEHSLPPQPTPAPWQQEIVAQALQALQSGMAALQELQRQTAAAHLRFLAPAPAPGRPQAAPEQGSRMSIQPPS